MREITNFSQFITDVSHCKKNVDNKNAMHWLWLDELHYGLSFCVHTGNICTESDGRYLAWLMAAGIWLRTEYIW